MAKEKKLMKIVLDLFGEGGDGAGASAQGDAQGAAPETTRGSKSGETKILYGKQSSESGEIATGAKDPPAAGESGKGQVTSDTLEERRKAYNELINGEYKDFYTQDTQRIIDKRFRETKNLEAQLAKQQPLMDMLAQRYNVTDGDPGKLQKALDSDTVYWAQAAEDAGMTVEQYREFSRLKSQNKALLDAQQRRQNQDAAMQTLHKWTAEAEQLKAKYPKFDLDAECANRDFLSMLKSGVPVEHAYKVIHMDEIVNEAKMTTAAQTEKRVVDNVRAKGSRPAENGAAAQSGFIVKDDVSKLTKKDRAEIAKRVMRGDVVSF